VLPGNSINDMYSTIDFELDLARNFRGDPLDDDVRVLIKHYLQHPSIEAWDELSHQVIMSVPNLKVTFWGAVTIVDPAFQRVRNSVGNGRYEPWQAFPPPAVLLEALRYATH
jgi:hypothetical protein